MSAIKKVLVATDLGECSQPALDRARGIAEQFGATLHVLNVVTEPLHETWACYAPGSSFIQIVEELEREARGTLEREFGITEGAGAYPVVIATSWGNPSDEILKYADENDIDLLVCGTHGRRGFDHVLMGSVAERLVRRAPCPVLTVRGDAPVHAKAAA